MPHYRRPGQHHRHHGNRAPIPVNPSQPVGLAPTILPNTLVPATIPTKLPARTIHPHQSSVFLTIPTVGPLPSVRGSSTIPPTGGRSPTVANDPSVVVSPPPVGPYRPGRAHHGPAYNPGMPMARGHRGQPGRIHVHRH